MSESLTISRETVNYLLAEEGYSIKAIKKTVERVNRGAKALDEAKPRWVYDIIPEKLRMVDATFCVCGQVFGDYCNRTIAQPIEQSMRHGFTTSLVPEFDVDWNLLDLLWSALIKQRHVRRRRVFLKLP